MKKAFSFLDRFKLHLLSLLVAIGLWMLVHGQGQGSLTMEVPLQVRGLPEGMMIVNDLPDGVRITVTGLQSRLKEFQARAFFIPVDASDITSPGVVHRALQISEIQLPVGLRIEKAKPDTLELQVDRKIHRLIPVHAIFELPAGWKVKSVMVEPDKVELSGPEVWLGSLPEVQTNPIRLKRKIGPFEVQAGIASPSGKGIRMASSNARFIVRGVLIRDAIANSAKHGEE